jgi:hypothetical protein
MCKAWVEIKNGKIIKGKGHLIICSDCQVIEVEKTKKRRK